MTRVALVLDAFWPNVGGVEILAAELGEAMIARGYEVAVITGRTDDSSPAEDEHRGIPVYRFPFAQAVLHRKVDSIAHSMSRLARVYDELRPDLYHVFPTGPAALFHLKASSRHPAPSIVGIQLAMPKRQEDGQLTGRLLRSADWVTACSQRTLDYTRSLVPEITSRSSLVYNGLQAAESEPEPPVFEEPRLLCLGRVVEDKGFDLALRAFPSILEEFSDARLIVAGTGTAKQDLEHLAADLGVDHRVEFLGRVDREDVPELIDTASLVVMPSRWEEAFGLVALEAAQRARPVVATRVGGLQEVVADGETGLLVPREDPGALANAIIRLLQEPEAASELGRNARDRAIRVFGWSRYVDEHDALYRRLIHEHASEGARA